MMSSLPGQRSRFVRVLGFAFACALLASLSSSQTSQSNPPPASFAAPPISSVSGTEVGQTGFWSVTKGDFNGDGILDFAVAGFNCSNGTSIPADSIAVYLGNGDGTFESPHTYSAGHCPNQIVAGRFPWSYASAKLSVVGFCDFLFSY